MKNPNKLLEERLKSFLHKASFPIKSGLSASACEENFIFWANHLSSEKNKDNQIKIDIFMEVIYEVLVGYVGNKYSFEIVVSLLDKEDDFDSQKIHRTIEHVSER